MMNGSLWVGVSQSCSQTNRPQRTRPAKRLQKRLTAIVTRKAKPDVCQVYLSGADEDAADAKLWCEGCSGLLVGLLAMLDHNWGLRELRSIHQNRITRRPRPRELLHVLDEAHCRPPAAHALAPCKLTVPSAADVVRRIVCVCVCMESSSLS